MEIGKRLREARLEAGLSQRALCGDVITRNMLSQIENGAAKPSMATLQYLAGQLGKPVGYFLEEQTVLSANIDVMGKARDAYAARQYNQVLQILKEYQSPDPLFDEEMRYLKALCMLAQADMLLAERNLHQAVALLENIDRGSIYYRTEMEQMRRQLLRRAYPLLEEDYRKIGNYEQAYYCACKIRDLQA